MVESLKHLATWHSGTLREQLFEKELGKVRTTTQDSHEDVPSNYGCEQTSPTYALTQLVLEIEHSEVDSTEVILGTHTSTDTQLGAATGSGYVAECEDVNNERLVT